MITRVKTIIVSDGDVDIEVKARVRTRNLNRPETDNLIHELASCVMRGLPSLPYVGAHLSNIRVKP